MVNSQVNHLVKLVQRALRLLFTQKRIVSENVILAGLSRMITSRFFAGGGLYGTTTWSVTSAKIKLSVWTHFVESTAL